MRKISCLALLASAAVVAPAAAQGVAYDNSNQRQVSSLPGFLTSFNQLGGMAVTWTDASGTCTQNWGVLSGNTWGVSGANCADGSDFSLTANGPSQAYFSLWSLHGTGVTEFSMYALSGNAVFDDGSNPSTPGSSLGNAYNYCALNLGFFCLLNTPDHWSTVATYSDEVGVGGNAAYGDLWGKLTVDFGSAFGDPYACGTSSHPDKVCYQDDVTFVQDADQAAGGSAGVPESVTPEPASMSLMAMGLVGMIGAGYRRRRRNG